jgi:thioredoxin-like negative regulator of GroEL
MNVGRQAHPAKPPTRVRGSDTTRQLPALLFVRQRQDGASRRMESLVAWVKVTQKKRLRVIDVDADRNPALTRELDVSEIPALVLVKSGRVVARLDGRATGRQIDEFIRPHLAA